MGFILLSIKFPLLMGSKMPLKWFIQRRAARFIKGDYQLTSSVTEMLKTLQWDSLRSRWSMGLFKRVNFTCNSKLIANICKPNLRVRGRHAYLNPFIEMHARTDIYYWSFFLRTINQWNNLPKDSLKFFEI